MGDPELGQTQERRPAPAIRIRFEIPRSEVDRAREAAATSKRAIKHFAREHLRGRVCIDVGVPFEPDPVLTFLENRRGLSIAPPHTACFDVPVGWIVDHLAISTLLAVAGEPPSMVPLPGYLGAIGVEREGDRGLAFSFPLKHYAGVAVVPLEDGTKAVAAAVDALHELIQSHVPSVLEGRYGRFLQCMSEVLHAAPPVGDPPEAAPILLPAFDPDAIRAAARAREEAGSYIALYWKVSAEPKDPSRIWFLPIQRPGRPQRRGALALAIGPSGTQLFLPSIPGAPEGEAELKERLVRRTPFVATVDAARGALLSIELEKWPAIEEEPQ